MTEELRDLVLDGLEDGYEEITSVEAILLREADPDDTAEMPVLQLIQLCELCIHREEENNGSGHRAR